MSLKIAFMIGPTLAGTKNGVVSQALTWKAGLEAQGVTVDLVTPWQGYEWENYDTIHLFGTGHFLEIVQGLKLRGARRIVLSPIFDTNRANFITNVGSRLNFWVASLRTSLATFRSSIVAVDKVLARSEFEANNLRCSFGIPSSKIEICALPVRFAVPNSGVAKDRHPICCHVSILSAPIKNVHKLVEASIRYKFPLRLGGSIPDPNFRSWLNQETHRHKHIEYLGILTDEELKTLYLQSKVFALPSLAEGVGLVGLEAALHGADIVLTERGGPKEYYAGMANLVDPTSVDEIGRAVMSFLNGQTSQPQLSRHISKEFSIKASALKLISVYSS